MPYSHLPQQLQPLARGSEAQQMEYATSAFWQIACQLRFPLNENYICIGKQHVDSSRRRVDVKVEHIAPYADNYAPILLVEVKGTGESLKRLEEQAKDYGLRLLGDKGLNLLWIQTIRGLTYRHWRLAPEGEMRAMTGTDRMGLKDEYFDVKTEGGWAQWWRDSGKMKAQHPLSTAPVLASQQHQLPIATSSYAVPAHVSQVDGWEAPPATSEMEVEPQGDVLLGEGEYEEGNDKAER